MNPPIACPPRARGPIVAAPEPDAVKVDDASEHASSGRRTPPTQRRASRGSAPHPDPATDVELALRSREDPEAFAQLYQRYRAPIYRMIYARLRQREAAEDVTSEVFVKALRSIDGYRPSSAPFWGWLYRIAANAVVDHVRARRVTTGLENVLERPDPKVRVEDVVLERVEAERVWSAVGTLSHAQRTAVTLRLAQDLPIANIAGRMDRTEGAVKQLLNRGMATVRAQLLDAVG
jgi:RNA polymerase sigma-70 factor (ECF subfamily)